MVNVDGSGAAKNGVVSQLFAGLQKAQEAYVHLNSKGNERRLNQWRQQHRLLEDKVTASLARNAEPSSRDAAPSLKPLNEHAVLEAALAHHLTQKPTAAPPPRLVFGRAPSDVLQATLDKGQHIVAVVDTEADHLWQTQALSQLNSMSTAWDSKDTRDGSSYVRLKEALQTQRSTPSEAILNAGQPKGTGQVQWQNSRMSVCFSVRPASLAAHLAAQPENASDHGFLERCLFTPLQAQAPMPELRIEAIGAGQYLPDRSTQAQIVLDRFKDLTYRMALSRLAYVVHLEDLGSDDLQKVAALGCDAKPYANLFPGLNAYLSRLQENAWRIALVLCASIHASERRLHSETKISMVDDCVPQACRLVDWYLQAYLHTFAPPYKHPTHIATDAQSLEAWLIRKATAPVPSKGVLPLHDGSFTLERNTILRSGPFRRNGAAMRLNLALHHLLHAKKVEYCPYPPNQDGGLRIKIAHGQSLHRLEPTQE